MVTSDHQISMGCEIEDRRPEARPNDKHMVQLPAVSPAKGTGEGETTFQLEYNELTDVMFIDLEPLRDGSNVSVIDIGDKAGFPGQVQVRVDLEQQIFFGITIQNYSGFRRRLLWCYRMWSMQAALRFLLAPATPAA